MKRDRPSAATTELPWQEDRIDRVFRDMLRDFFTGGARFERFTDGFGSMHLEEFVDDGEYVIRAEIPGIDPDKDVDISIDAGVLRIRASREEREEDKKPDGYRSEFHYGSFERLVRLPDGAGESDVTATYQDGILEVRVPVPAPAKEPTKIAITHK